MEQLGTGDAPRRAAVAQRIEQPGGECRCPLRKRERMIMRIATLRFDPLGSAHHFLPSHIRRLQAMAQWKAVAVVS